MHSKPGPLLRRAAAGLACAAAAAAVVTLTRTARRPEKRVPPVRWLPCDQVLTGAPPVDPKVADCAVHHVPRDHSKPSQGTVKVVMLRRKASDQTRRKGSVFVNPGGPGQSGLHFAYRAETYLAPEVLARYDVIGFDPRGVGQSDPVKCFSSQDETDTASRGKLKIPVSPAEIAATLQSHAAYTDSCQRKAGPLLSHMTTLNVARDLDLLRQGIGADRLNFVGFSYGTMIGATYANVFPQQTGALVLDGNIDPLLRMTDGAEYERQRARGAEETLTAFLRSCKENNERCAFGENDPEAKFHELHEKLRHTPLVLPDGTTVDLSSFTDYVTTALSAGDLSGLARALTDLHAIIMSETALPVTGAASAFAAPIPQRGQRYCTTNAPYRGDDSGNAVNCADKPYSGSAACRPIFAEEWEQESPVFGRWHAFEDAPCATWPVRWSDTDRYTGPWNQPTSRTVLVLGNRFDPITQHVFAERMAALLANAHLVTVDQFGHTALGNNACAEKLVSHYLLQGYVPRSGTVCPPDTPPFTSEETSAEKHLW